MPSHEYEVAVVTGAARGIGRALAAGFLRSDMRVVLADIDEQELRHTVEQFDSAAARGVPVDVANAESVDQLRDAALDMFGRVDVVCNNAGIGGGGAISSGNGIDLDRWHKVFGVDFFGAVHGVRSFLPVLSEQGGGHIFNVASRQGLVTTPGLGAYCPAKFATVAMTEMLHAELARAKSPVAVSVICPGGVRTDMLLPPPPESDSDDEITRLKRERFMNSVSAEFVTELVLEAMVTKPLYVLTHWETIEWMRSRVDAIATDMQRSAVLGVGDPGR
jgi:NAD(P)-dependent dehydrogenase (short-subunit alcohol dehydrogenase family)